MTDWDQFGGNGKVSVIDSTANAVIAEINPNASGFPQFVNPYAIAVSQDGQLICVGDRGNHLVYFIDGTYTVTGIVSNPAFMDLVFAAIKPDKSQVVISDQSANVFVIDTTFPYTVAPVAGAAPAFVNPVGIIISLDGSTAYVADRSSNEVYVIDIATATATALVSPGAVVPVHSQALYLALSADGTFSYLTDFFGANVYKINMLPMPPVVSDIITNGVGPAFIMTTGVSITPDQSFAFVIDYMTQHVYKINTTTNQVTASVTDPGFLGLTGISIIPDGTLAYVCASTGGAVYSVDTTTLAINQVSTAGFSAFINPALVATTPAAAIDSIRPPNNLGNKQTNTDFGIIYYFSNTLTWQPSLSVGVVSYNIYRNGIKIASVSGSTLQYTDIKAPKGRNQYGVTATDSQGRESVPINIQVN